MTTRDEVIAAAKEAGLDVRSNEVVTGYYYEEITSEIVRLYVLAFKAGMERAVEVCEKEKSIVRAENARLKQELAQITSDRNAKSARMWELGKLCDELEPDAKRYRWLREACETKEGWGWLICDADADVVRKLDVAIDEAIRKENYE